MFYSDFLIPARLFFYRAIGVKTQLYSIFRSRLRVQNALHNANKMFTSGGYIEKKKKFFLRADEDVTTQRN